MERQAIEAAAAYLAKARREGARVDRLPVACRPATVAEAHAIQDATLLALGDGTGAWKVSPPLDGVLLRGAIPASRLYASPVQVPAADVSMLGVEAEIAFRLDRDLPPRAEPYGYDEVAGAVTALVAIEIVHSRFSDYQGTPPIERAADCVSNGGLVHGTPRANWRSFDLRTVVASLDIDGKTIVRQSGGHVAGDPLLPAIAQANAGSAPLRAGMIVTTGTYTGLQFAKPGQTVTAAFDGFGSVSVTFVV